MGNINQDQSSEHLSRNFYTMLDEKIQGANRSTLLDQLASFLYQRGMSHGGLQAGYSMIILLIGLGLGYLLMGKSDKSEITALSSEVKEMKSMMMLNLLEKESPSARIKAVSLTQNMAEVDEEIINALFSTLTNDNNTNVRLEALDALVRYSNRPTVRVGLIKSLAEQTNPLVQLGLADIMVLFQDKNAKEALEGILKSKELTEDVRMVIKERLNSINI
jgi:HEAT repeat protein